MFTEISMLSDEDTLNYLVRLIFIKKEYYDKWRELTTNSDGYNFSDNLDLLENQPTHRFFQTKWYNYRIPSIDKICDLITQSNTIDNQAKILSRYIVVLEKLIQAVAEKLKEDIIEGKISYDTLKQMIGKIPSDKNLDA